MDPTSGFGAAVSLIELLSKATMYFRKFRKLYHLSRELKEIANSLQSIQSFLKLLNGIISKLGDHGPDEELRLYLSGCSTHVDLAFKRLDTVVEKFGDDINVCRRVIQVFWKGGQLTEVVKMCNLAKEKLKDAVPFVEMLVAQHNARQNKQMVAEVRAEVFAQRHLIAEIQSHKVNEVDERGAVVTSEALTIESKESHREAPDIRHGKAPDCNSCSTWAVEVAETFQLFDGTPFSLHRMFKRTALSRSGTYVVCWNRYRGSHELIINLTFPKFLGHRVLRGQFVFQRRYLSWSNFSIRPSLGVYRTISCQSKIWRACNEGDLEEVRYLIEVAGQATARDLFDEDLSRAHHNDAKAPLLDGCCCFGYTNGDSLLKPAIRSRSRLLVEFLLQAGAGVNEANDDLRSPIFDAFETGQVTMAQVLIGQQADIEQVDKGGHNVIHALTDMALENIPHKTATNPDAHPMVKAGLELLKLCEGWGFYEFDGPRADRLTHVCPLVSLIKCGIAPLSLELLRLGATGRMECYSSKRGVIKTNSFHAAAEGGDIEVFKLLRERNPRTSIDCTNHGGETPLHSAISAQNVEMVQWLLKEGADPNLVDENGRQPLSKAICRGLPGGRSCSLMIDALMERGASVSYGEEGTRSALQEAATIFHVDAVRALLRHGASVRFRSSCGLNSLQTLSLAMSILGQFEELRAYVSKRAADIRACITLFLQAGADFRESGSIPDDLSAKPEFLRYRKCVVSHHQKVAVYGEALFSIMRPGHVPTGRFVDQDAQGQRLTAPEIACRYGNRAARDIWQEALREIDPTISLNEDGVISRACVDAVEDLHFPGVV